MNGPNSMPKTKNRIRPVDPILTSVPRHKTDSKPWTLFQWLLFFLYFSSVFAKPSQAIDDDNPSMCDVPRPVNLLLQDYASLFLCLEGFVEPSKVIDDSPSIGEVPEPMEQLLSQEYISVYARTAPSAFQQIEECLKEGNHKHACEPIRWWRHDLLRKPNEDFFDYLYFHPENIEKVFQTYVETQLLGWNKPTENMAATYKSDLSYNLRYQFEKRLADQLSKQNVEEVKRLLSFRQQLGEHLLEKEPSYEVWRKFEWPMPKEKDIFSEFTNWNVFPDMTLEPSSQQGLACHIAQGDSDGAAWLVRHLAKRSREYAKSMVLALKNAGKIFRIDQFVSQLSVVLDKAIVDSSETDLDSVLNSLLVLHKIAPDSTRVKSQIDTLIYRALDSDNAKCIERVVQVGLAQQFPFDSQRFAKQYTTKPELPSLLPNLFHNRDEEFNEVKILYAQKHSEYLDPYSEIERMLSVQDISLILNDVLNCIFPDKHTEKNNPSRWLDYLLSNPDAMVHLHALWSEAGSRREPFFRRYRELFFKTLYHAYFEALQQANEIHNFARLNQLFEFYMQFENSLIHYYLDSERPSQKPNWHAFLMTLSLNELSDEAFLALTHLATAQKDIEQGLSLALSKLSSEAFTAKMQLIDSVETVAHYSKNVALNFQQEIIESLQRNDNARLGRVLSKIQHQAYQACIPHLDWNVYYQNSKKNQNIEHLEYLLQHPFATQPSNDILKYLLDNNRLELLKTLNAIHPEWINEEFAVLTITDATMSLAETIIRTNPQVRKEVMASSALNTGNYVFAKLAIEFMSTITADNDIANRLQHKSAMFDLQEHEKLLLAKGARPDFKENGKTPLDIALRLDRVEFAWLMVDAYQAQDIPIREKLLFDVLSFFKRAFAKMAQGDLPGSARLGFFKAIHDSRFQRISAVSIGAVLVSCLAAMLIKKCWRATQEANRQIQIQIQNKANFLSECRRKLGLIILSEDFNKYLEEPSAEIVTDAICPITFGLLFPLCMTMSDGKSYSITERNIDELFAKRSTSPFSNVTLNFEEVRLDINLISYSKIKIEQHLENEIKKLTEQIQNFPQQTTEQPTQQELNEAQEKLQKLQSYKQELSELKYPFELFDNIDACLRDPNTKAIMEHPCIAPDGKSYEVTTLPEDKCTRFETNIAGLGNVIVYRNYTLQEICAEHPRPTQARDSRV